MRALRVMAISVMMLCLTVAPWQNAQIKAYDQTTFGWGYKKNTEHNPPDAGKYGNILDKYDSYYVDKSGEKVVYLTFDLGYEAGHTELILDILKQQKIPAAFFLAGHYITSATDLVKRMHEEGHVIGNHSYNHHDFTTLSEEKIKEELNKIDEELDKTIGVRHTQFVRPPRGDFSERTLAITEKLGYTSVFWSAALVDWGSQNGQQSAYKDIVEHIHPGAIILLHATSKDNALALEHLIDELRKRGYQFKSLEYLLWKEHVPFQYE
ncbi:peptidoglycan-N-acetylmuramic acid deacetylase [Salinibacillus kushneri]|uniref:Peptidoglycan-N-acetylmuramic acid deacetylase n=1 Tax=Salinibacillus kushneri TaxID=237682 RepID=A0A1I0GPE2_9BACI|nr:delta-lactam-biosynthetic de-N-acetylase [Salinibacillus kushneri]SET72839.1 peptidoglycan-N-acetylmuramic acid deacetylase [Salinibacillus kushneri]